MRVAIAGAGNVGRAIARELLDNGHQVLLIDKDPKPTLFLQLERGGYASENALLGPVLCYPNTR